MKEKMKKEVTLIKMKKVLTVAIIMFMVLNGLCICDKSRQKVLTALLLSF